MTVPRVAAEQGGYTPRPERPHSSDEPAVRHWSLSRAVGRSGAPTGSWGPLEAAWSESALRPTGCSACTLS